MSTPEVRERLTEELGHAEFQYRNRPFQTTGTEVGYPHGMPLRFDKVKHTYRYFEFDKAIRRAIPQLYPDTEALTKFNIDDRVQGTLRECGLSFLLEKNPGMQRELVEEFISSLRIVREQEEAGEVKEWQFSCASYNWAITADELRGLFDFPARGEGQIPETSYAELIPFWREITYSEEEFLGRRPAADIIPPFWKIIHRLIAGNVYMRSDYGEFVTEKDLRLMLMIGRGVQVDWVEVFSEAFHMYQNMDPEADCLGGGSMILKIAEFKKIRVSKRGRIFGNLNVKKLVELGVITPRRRGGDESSSQAVTATEEGRAVVERREPVPMEVNQPAPQPILIEDSEAPAAQGQDQVEHPEEQAENNNVPVTQQETQGVVQEQAEVQGQGIPTAEPREVRAEEQRVRETTRPAQSKNKQKQIMEQSEQAEDPEVQSHHARAEQRKETSRLRFGGMRCQGETSTRPSKKARFEQHSLPTSRPPSSRTRQQFPPLDQKDLYLNYLWLSRACTELGEEMQKQSAQLARIDRAVSIIFHHLLPHLADQLDPRPAPQNTPFAPANPVFAEEQDPALSDSIIPDSPDRED